ncbi:MAG: hypothetical protein K8953_12050 [Proteobacteria bacterium]|nr:hypothetical protein [Pseudomonadota bacterium]
MAIKTPTEQQINGTVRHARIAYENDRAFKVCTTKNPFDAKTEPTLFGTWRVAYENAKTGDELMIQRIKARKNQ